ncbi:MAG: hypothetical protein KF760_05455 [Candidatus Eremiobacteraeota bacterium]|nr:hypothetical protein [Candidatus Eremiobacteraeota bacterium]MCW5867734.1 hypothetical protein [Candidatus Eremiobacteraeota bacterium]
MKLGTATLGLVGLVAAADMIWSPRLAEPAAPAARRTAENTTPSNLPEAIELYTSSQWEGRRRAAAYLLKQPVSQRREWELVSAALAKAPAPASAWQCWPKLSGEAPAQGFFGAYQNRLSGLRRAQLQASAERLRSVLEKNDYAAYLRQLPPEGESRGPLGLALTLQPLSRVGREDLIPYGVWWSILVNQSNDQALRAGIRLSRGQTPEMPHRWEGRTCVCWSPGPDGQDDGGQLEASLDDPSQSLGDWIYRFR